MNFLRKYKNYLIIFTLSFSMLLLTAFLAGVFIFEENFNFVSDASNQYYFFHRMLQERFQNLNFSAYAPELGLGINFFLLATYYLISPWNLLLFLIPLTENSTQIFMIITTFVNLSIGATIMYHFIETKYKINTFMNFSLSLLYSFSPFFLLYRYNIMWTFPFALFPLIILFVEDFFEKEELISTKFILLFALSTLTNFFISFIFLITIVIFYLIKLLGNFKLKKVLALITNLTLGALVSSVIIFVAKDYIFEYYKMDFELASLYSKTFYNFNLFEFLKNLFIEQQTSHTLGNKLIFVGPLVFSIIILRILKKKKLEKEQITYLLMFLFVFLSFVIPKLNYIFSGFHNNRGILFRHAFLVPFFLIILVASFIKEIDFKEKKNCWLLVFLPLYLFNISIFFFALLIFILIIKNNLKYSNIGILAVTIIFLTPFIFKSHKELMTPKVEYPDIKLDGRISINRHPDIIKTKDILGYYLANNYYYGNTVQYRSSTLNHKLAYGLINLGFVIVYEVDSYYKIHNPVADMLLGIKYNYSSKNFEKSYLYSEHENRITKTNLLFEDGFFTNNLRLDSKDDNFLTRSVCRFTEDCDLWNYVDIETDDINYEASSDGFYYLISEESLFYPDRYIQDFISLGFYEEGDRILFNTKTFMLDFDLVFIEEEFIENLYNRLNNFKKDGNTITTESPGYYILPHVYDVSLNAYVNNQQVDIINIDDVFAAIYLDEGDNEVIVDYQVKDFGKYLAISLITTTFVIAISMYKKDYLN